MMKVYQYDLFSSTLANHLNCSDDFGNVVCLPKKEAFKKPYIALNNRSFINHLVFDIDQPEAGAAWLDADFLQPTWVCQNPENGHAHLGYALAAPVSRTLAAKASPQRYLARIQQAMTERLGADRAYAHFLTKTPEHPKWRTIWGWQYPYTLDQLRDELPDNLPLAIRKKTAVGEGRNVWLFDTLRLWAYKARLNYENYPSWLVACTKRAIGLNTFTSPLPINEINSTSRSVAKWTFKNITPAGLREFHSRKGKFGMKKRWGQKVTIEQLNFLNEV